MLSNLSRHLALCEHFVADKAFIEALVLILDHTLRELVFYSIGIIINITMHEGPRQLIVNLQPSMLPRLIDVLKDANIEDMDLSKVASKALHNLAVKNAQGDTLLSWTNDELGKLDEILSALGEELDSIMDVANEDELHEINGLRELVNALINDMPEVTFKCADVLCGRRFKNREELDKHTERRHNPPQ